MAAHFLRLVRLGSLKGLQVESCGALRGCPSAAFATSTREPKKPGKKAKAPIVEGAAEQASLLAYRTSGAFSSKVSFPEAPPAQALGASEPKAQTASTVVGSEGVTHAEAPKDPVPSGTETVPEAPGSATPPAEPEGPATVKASITESSTTKPGASKDDDAPDKGESSPSSSSSDSDSDSDSDDEEEVKAKAETRDDPAAEGLAQPDKKVPAACEAASEGSPEVPPKTIEMSTPDVKLRVQVGHPSATAIDGASEAVPAVASAEAEVGGSEGAASRSKEAQDSVTMVQKIGPPTKPAPAAREVAPVTVSEAQLATEAAAALSPEAAKVVSCEEMMDPAPVLADAPGEELQPEAHAEPEPAESCEEAPPPPAEPEPEPEPFDNSTYKNLQHHQYDKYTFLDMEVEMAKHRLPQPSSGRPSPHH